MQTHNQDLGPRSCDLTVSNFLMCDIVLCHMQKVGSQDWPRPNTFLYKLWWIHQFFDKKPWHLFTSLSSQQKLQGEWLTLLLFIHICRIYNLLNVSNMLQINKIPIGIKSCSNTDAINSLDGEYGDKEICAYSTENTLKCAPGRPIWGRNSSK